MNKLWRQSQNCYFILSVKNEKICFRMFSKIYSKAQMKECFLILCVFIHTIHISPLVLYFKNKLVKNLFVLLAQLLLKGKHSVMVSFELSQFLLEARKICQMLLLWNSDLAFTIHLTPGYTGINNGFLYDEAVLI